MTDLQRDIATLEQRLKYLADVEKKLKRLYRSCRRQRENTAESLILLYAVARDTGE